MMTRSLPAFRLARTAQAIVLLLLLLSISASARRRDPLTDAETDQLREVAMEPLKRLPGSRPAKGVVTAAPRALMVAWSRTGEVLRNCAGMLPKL